MSGRRRRCKHSAGWYTVNALVHVSATQARVTIGHGRVNDSRVELRCNLLNCDSVRYAYFDEGGTLVRLGPVRRRKDAADQGGVDGGTGC